DRVTSCTFNPNNANQIFMTSETNGLWVSNNINAATPAFSLVTSYPFQQPERVYFNPYNTTEMWVSSFGNGMKTGTVTVTGTVEFSRATETAWSAYPNPASSEVTILCQLKNAVKLEVTDLTGRLVYSRELNASDAEIKLDVSAFENGTYLTRITGTEQTTTGKFIVMK
ncbi:MAG: T9SS type A sorting domain-containing protein, partial [Bacteroidia bacterium]